MKRKNNDESWKEVIENKPDWAKFITKSEKNFFEYHETKPKIVGFFHRDWLSDGKQEGYYGDDLFGEGIFNGEYVTPECLDLSSIESGDNFVQGDVVNQLV